MNVNTKLFSIIDDIPSPAYVIDEEAIHNNLKLLKEVSDRSGAKILLAQKAFSAYHLYPLIAEYLVGTTASSLHEARLGFEEMPNRETHIFSPAFREDEIDEILNYTDHIVFNSFSQLNRYRERVLAHSKTHSIGLRLNPECSTQNTTALYDPCAPFSRMGVIAAQFQEEELVGVEGFHMHTLCEQDSDDLIVTVRELENKFGKYFHHVKWLNLGGGHHITRQNYDLEALISELLRLRDKYQLQIYLEPGEAIALNAGYLVTEVLDFVENGMTIALLDSSAECHMPDVLAMPYRPPLYRADQAGKLPFTYRLSSATCLAGDVIGDYSFAQNLKTGDRLILGDMAIYTMVKNNTFNGINLPSIILLKSNGEFEIVKEFGYDDFKSRL